MHTTTTTLSLTGLVFPQLCKGIPKVNLWGFLSGYFYRSDNLPATQPTTPRQWRETSENGKVQNIWRTTALTLNTKQVISETFFAENLLASTENNCQVILTNGHSICVCYHKAKMFKMCVCVHAITRINYQVFTNIKHPLTLYIQDRLNQFSTLHTTNKSDPR